MCERCFLGNFFYSKKNDCPTNLLTFFFQQKSPIQTMIFCPKKAPPYNPIKKKKMDETTIILKLLKVITEIIPKFFRGEKFAKKNGRNHHLAVLVGREITPAERREDFSRVLEASPTVLSLHEQCSTPF